jgi:sugar phosphate isomerase/epimerase
MRFKLDADMFGHTKLSRRQCLRAVAGAAAASSLSAAVQTRVTGVQLYAVRAALKRDPDRTLQALAAIGFKDVEGYSRPDTVALAPKLKQYGLNVRSCQVETPLITADWDLYPELKQVALPEAIDSLASAGVEYFTLGYISPGARGDNDDFFRRTADRMNAAAELGRKSGLRFAWQNHAFEFEGQPGSRPVDIYKERLDQKLVGLELNVFWASVAGQDPLRLFKEWKGRVPLLQLNDKAKDAPRQFSENLGIGAFVEAGAGDIEFPAILKAAPAAGVRFQFAGQDESLSDPIESLRRSFAYLNR